MEGGKARGEDEGEGEEGGPDWFASEEAEGGKFDAVHDWAMQNIERVTCLSERDKGFGT